MSRTTIKELNKTIANLKSLLKPAHCPICDGTGVIGHPVTRTGSGIGPDGEQVAIPVQDMEFEECQWCWEKDQILKE